MTFLRNHLSMTALALTLSLVLSGCSTIGSAYNTTVDTVSGWFKSDDKKEAQK